MLKFLLLLATHALCLGCGVRFRDEIIAALKRKSADALAEIKADGVKKAP